MTVYIGNNAGELEIIKDVRFISYFPFPDGDVESEIVIHFLSLVEPQRNIPLADIVSVSVMDTGAK